MGISVFPPHMRRPIEKSFPQIFKATGNVHDFLEPLLKERGDVFIEKTVAEMIFKPGISMVKGL